MRNLTNIAAAALIGGLLAGPAIANAPARQPVTVKEYPLNFETGASGKSAPITLYRHNGELAFVVIDSVDGAAQKTAAYRINIGSIAHYDGGGAADAGFKPAVGKTRVSFGSYLPLRKGEAVTLQLANQTALKVKAHVMVVTGYGA